MAFSSRAGSTVRAVFNRHATAVGCVRIVLVALVGLVLVWRLDPALPVTVPMGLLWRNALPVSLFALLLYGLSGRTLLSIWLTGWMAWLVFAVNAIKERNMNAPLMPGDWVLKDQLLHHLSFFSHYAGRGVVMLLGIAIFLAVCWMLWRCERYWPRPAAWARVVWVLLPLVLLYAAFSGGRPWNRVYSDQALVGFQLWDPVASVRHTGLMAGLVRMTQESRVRVPTADASVIADFVKFHAGSLNSRATRQVPAELPDIVVVQSEAFFDPSILKGVDPDDFTPNFDRLAAAGITGKLVTPAYGGGTIRTEFETLTGYPMRAFPSIVYPYYGLVGGWMPSVPRRLQAFGYSTTLFHPFRADFWNRQEVMPELGFQRSYYEKDFAKAARAGLYISDQALFSFVLAQLDKEHDAPSYTMLITMENHGPWKRDAVDLPHALDGRSLPTGLSAKGTREMAYYLAHLVNGDAALGDFARDLMARPRWTVMLFYGDHLPSLDDAFKDTGFDDSEGFSAQRTRYMLISNRPIKPRELDLSAYELPGLLFDTLGLPGDGYLAFDGAIREAAAQAQPEQGAHYGQVSFNAARMEVRCRQKLSLAGTCPRRLSSESSAVGQQGGAH
jgi:phosphoglycerol transferase MdoB-like AlkP superfamily enzyme